MDLENSFFGSESASLAPAPVFQARGITKVYQMGEVKVHARRGRYIEPVRDGEVLVSEAFAEAHNFVEGDTVTAIINGRRQTLEIVGIVLSPEYVIQLQGGTLLPDARRFGVFWMSYDQLAAAFDMEGAFNDVSVSLMRGASEAEVMKRLDDLTETYGVSGAYSRDDHVSHHYNFRRDSPAPQYGNDCTDDFSLGSGVPAERGALAAYRNAARADVTKHKIATADNASLRVFICRHSFHSDCCKRRYRCHCVPWEEDMPSTLLRWMTASCTPSLC